MTKRTITFMIGVFAVIALITWASERTQEPAPPRGAKPYTQPFTGDR